MADKVRRKRQGGGKITTGVISEIIEAPKGRKQAKDAKETKETKALALTDPVAQYLAELRKYPLLSRKEEEELAVQYYETGDSKAAEILVTSNLRFVVKIAAEYSKFGNRMIDLIQEGNMGLMHAVREFNPYKGVRLITYAVWWIRGYIQEYLMRQHSLVRIGTTQAQKKLFYNLKKETEALEAAGFDVTPALLSSKIGVSEEDVHLMSQRLAQPDLSLNQPFEEGGENRNSYLDFQVDSNEVPVDERIGALENLELLKKRIEEIRPQLNERELYLLDQRILSDVPMTLQEIGAKYGVTREAVRQMEARLVEKIKADFLR